MSSKIKAKDVLADAIALEWVTMCLSDNKDSDWFTEKSKYWNINKEHLETMGFDYNDNIVSALDKVAIETIEGLEGALFIVRVGSENAPASEDELASAEQMISEALDDVEGVRAVIVPHNVHIEKYNVPQLRRLVNAVIAPRTEHGGNAVIGSLEIG